MIKILIGGSPCTHWSSARGAHGRETQPEGLGWELFKNYLIAKAKFQPDLFLYENNQSAAKPIKDKISQSLGVELMNINSALVSAQNRPRFYAFNWSVEPPADRGICITDIAEELDLGPIGPIKPSVRVNVEREYQDIVACQDKRLWHCECTNSWADNTIGLKKSPTIRANNRCCIIRDKNNSIRLITLTEAERLQTLPDGYTLGVPDTQRHKGIGNGWTAEVIIHIMNGALKDTPRDEEIVVLSMYDGIGTGRYCLDKMGFTNVTYYAYEIDKYAIQIASKNYPDIIQMGDAFAVRDPLWALGSGAQTEDNTDDWMN